VRADYTVSSRTLIITKQKEFVKSKEVNVKRLQTLESNSADSHANSIVFL